MSGPLFVDRIYETTNIIGSGNITLNGANQGYQPFSVIGSGNSTFYTITDDVNWETGIGTYISAGNVLRKDLILKSSNSNNAVSWGDLTSKKVFSSPPGEFPSYINVRTSFSSASANQVGKVVYPENSIALLYDNGSEFKPYGPIWDLTSPPSTGWTWDNQGSATIAETNGVLTVLTTDSNSTELRVRKRAAPTPPYTITTLICPTILFKNYHGFGIGFRQSSDSKMVLFSIVADEVYYNPRFLVETWSNSSTYVSTLRSSMIPSQSYYWLRIRDNNTNRYYEFSSDGKNFNEFYSEGRTTYLTANENCFFIRGQNNTTPNIPVSMSVLSWKQE